MRGDIIISKHISEYLPDNGNVYIYEEYFNNFKIISRREITNDQALAAVSYYLIDAKERPKYHNLREKILGEHKLFWQDELEKFEFHTRRFSYGY